MASGHTRGSVASRIQAFQDGQGSLSPKRSVQAQTSSQGEEADVSSVQVKRANTTSTAQTCMPPLEGKESSQLGGRLKSHDSRHGSVIGSIADKNYLNGSLPARPATSFDSIAPHQQHNPHSFLKQSPEKRATQRRQSSLNEGSATQNQLSEARARLRSVGEDTSAKPIDAPRGLSLSPVRRKTELHDLQNLIDNAIYEQVEPHSHIISTKQSPRLKSIASQVEMNIESPSRRHSIEAESNGSPLRRDRIVRSSSRPRVPVAAKKSLDNRNNDELLMPANQQISPTRKQRLSSESVLPRSSIDSEPFVTPAYPSVHSALETKPGHEITFLLPLVPGGHLPSPVKQRTAAFEKMMQHDKQIMNDQAHRHQGNIQIKKHWWLDSSDNNRGHRLQGSVKHEEITTKTKTGLAVQHKPPPNTRNVTPTARSGPIPLALPQLISSRGRTVSASSQFEDSFETAPQSEAALSRLSSRVHSPRTLTKASGPQDVGHEMRSALFRWKPFMLDRASSAHKSNPTLPASLEPSVRKGIPDQPRDTVSHLPHQAKDDTSLREDKQDNEGKGVQSNDVAQASTTRRSTHESRSPQRLTPRRLTLRNTFSAKQDLMSAADAVNTTMAKQASSHDIHSEAGHTEQECSSGDMTTDDEKEAARDFSDDTTEEHVETTSATAMEVKSSQRRSEDSIPFPLIPVEASISAPASASASASGPASGAGSPVRGRATSRILHRQSTVIKEEVSGKGNCVRVSRSRTRSKTGNVRVTVEVRTPQGSPRKGSGDKDGDRGEKGNGLGERVVIVTTDVQGEEE